MDTITVELAASAITETASTDNAGDHWTDSLFEGINLYLFMAASLVFLSCICGCCFLWWMHRHREQQKRVAYQFAYAVKNESQRRLQGLSPNAESKSISKSSSSPKYPIGHETDGATNGFNGIHSVQAILPVGPPQSHHIPIGSSSAQMTSTTNISQPATLSTVGTHDASGFPHFAMSSSVTSPSSGPLGYLADKPPPHSKGIIILQDSNDQIEMVAVDSNQTIPSDERRGLMVSAESNSPRSDSEILDTPTDPREARLSDLVADLGVKSVDVDRITTPQLNQFQFVASFSEQSMMTATTTGTGSNQISPFQPSQRPQIGGAQQQMTPFEIARSTFDNTNNDTVQTQTQSEDEQIQKKRSSGFRAIQINTVRTLSNAFDERAKAMNRESMVEREENVEDDEKATELPMDYETPMGPEPVLEPDLKSETDAIPSTEFANNQNGDNTKTEKELKKSPKIQITTPNATQNVEWQQLGYSRNMVNVPSASHSAQIAVHPPVPSLKDNASNSLSVDRINVMSEEIRSQPLAALSDHEDESENLEDFANPNRLSVNDERNRRNREVSNSGMSRSRSVESSTDGHYKYSRESSMILTDIESSGDEEQRLPIKKHAAIPRQTTMEFHHHLIDNVNVADTLMEDIVSDMAGVEDDDDDVHLD